MHAGLQYDDKMANTNKATESYIHEVEKNPIIWYFTMRRFTAITIDTLSHTVIHIQVGRSEKKTCIVNEDFMAR
jgi:hypothetical protein